MERQIDYKEFESVDFKARDVDATDRSVASYRDVDATDRSVASYRAGVQVSGAPHASNFPLSINRKAGFAADMAGLSIPGPVRAVKSKTVEISPSHLKNLQNVTSSPVALPHLQEMPIQDLVNPYNKSQVIILTTKHGTSAAEQDKYVRETFGISYSVLQSMAPALTFKPSAKDLKCKGSFTHDFCTCCFEAQAWRVDGKVHIYEFRRKTLGGKDAYEYLIRKMGAALKEAGRAEKYGNNIEIYPIPEDQIPDDLGELAMPSFGGVGSHTHMDRVDGDFPIDLSNDQQMKNWSDIIMERQWPMCEETLRVCARSCVHNDNRKAVAEHTDFQKSVINELRLNAGDATSCHNALTIMSAVLEESGAECFVEDGLLHAVARTLMTYSGIRQKGKPKTTRSVALERAALEVLVLLSDNADQYDEKQIRTVLDILEGDMGGKLKDEVNQVQLEYVIGNLKKQK